MKNQVLFSSKDKSKELKCHVLQYLFGSLRVNRKQDRYCLLGVSSSCGVAQSFV